MELTVTPGASVSCIKGVNRWRNRLEVSVEGRAQEGEANGGLIELLSKVFGVSPNSLTITGGAKSRHKTVFAEGLTAETVGERIREVIGK